MVSVEFTNVHKRYEDGFEAVKGLNLKVNDGEFLVLLGPSGCGKSTTLRMLAGLEEITEGTVTIDGVTVNHLPAGARGLGMVFQSYALYPHMSVRDNLTFGLRMVKGEARLGDHELAERVKEAATMLELEEHLEKKPKELSGGQRQRVALARALYRDADLILLDEATSALDANSESVVQKALEDNLKGRTVLVIAHRMSTIRDADIIAVLEGGVVVEQGDHNGLLERGGRYAELHRLQQGATN